MDVVSRRGVLLGAGAIVAATMTGCAGEARAMPTAPSGAVVMIVRHAEKPPGHGAPYGVNPDGGRDAESLTVSGWTRAGALVELLAPAAGSEGGRPGLARPSRVVAADPSHGSRRPAQTVTPLAARLGVELVTSWRKGQETGLARALDRWAGATLVAWEHEAIPAIVAGLGPVSPSPPSSWPSSRFDMVWTFTRAGDGWRFAQVPQLLLAGDSPSPI